MNNPGIEWLEVQAGVVVRSAEKDGSVAHPEVGRQKKLVRS